MENVTKLFVAITGPDEVNDDSNHTWTANPPGGLGDYSYVWKRSEDGGPWGVVGTSQSYILAIEEEDPHFEVRVTVTSSGQRARASKEVLVCIPRVWNNLGTCEAADRDADQVNGGKAHASPLPFS